MVFREDELCGVFPLVNTGKAWVSLPHFSYGSILFQNEEIANSFAYVIDEAISGLTSLESGFYRFNFDEESISNKELAEKVYIRSLSKAGSEVFVESKKVTSVLSLAGSQNELWSSLNQNLRRKINKARQTEFEVVEGGIELLGDYYSVYTQNIIQLGSMNYSKSFFKDILNNWDYGFIKLFVVYSNSKPVAGALLASYNGFHENAFFATLKEFRKKYISDLMHWEMIKFCVEDISKSTSDFQSPPIYSFGRSTKNSGVYNYKNHWPVENHPLYNYTNIPDLRKNDWMLKVWGMLPGFVTKPMGARLIRHIY